MPSRGLNIFDSILQTNTVVQSSCQGLGSRLAARIFPTPLEKEQTRLLQLQQKMLATYQADQAKRLAEERARFAAEIKARFDLQEKAYELSLWPWKIPHGSMLNKNAISIILLVRRATKDETSIFEQACATVRYWLNRQAGSGQETFLYDSSCVKEGTALPMGDGLVVQARSLLRTEPFILVDVVCKSELEADISASMWGYNDGTDDLDKNFLVSSLSFAGVPKNNRDSICAYWAQYFVAALIDMMRIAQGKIYPAGHWTFAWMIEDAVHEAVTDSLAYNQLSIMSRIAERAPALAIFNMTELGAKLIQHKRPDAAKRCIAQAIQQFAALHGCRAPEAWDDAACLERVRDRSSREMAARIEGLIGSLSSRDSAGAIEHRTERTHREELKERAAPKWHTAMKAFKL